ncbi:MAG: TIGR02757 family protein [Nitrospirae bacterium]|nr:TIGR02757 family protein [Nitrospirota bacterium]
MQDRLLLKESLDKFYKSYNLTERINSDPIEFPHRYKRPEDIEVVGLIASALAYGKVTLFKPVLERIFKIMGESPYDFILHFKPEKDSSLFKGIKYRMNKEDDIVCLLYLISRTVKEFGSLKQLFLNFYNPTHDDIGAALSGFVDYFLKIDTSAVYGKDIRPFGLLQFFPSPVKGSTCKRFNMFLRWMVRSGDGVDLGIWNEIPPSKLIIPLDTHTARICRHIGLTKRKSADWKMAKEITENLKIFDPDDPVKYDFAICHLGISGECPTAPSVDKCGKCNLSDICIALEPLTLVLSPDGRGNKNDTLSPLGRGIG